MINVVSKADGKPMACGNGKYLDKSNSLPKNQIAEQRNVQIQAGYARELCRLSQREEVANFGKEIETDADNHLIAGNGGNRDSRICSFMSEAFFARVIEQKTASINRQSLAAEADGIVFGNAASLEALIELERLPLRAIK